MWAVGRWESRENTLYSLLILPDVLAHTAVAIECVCVCVPAHVYERVYVCGRGLINKFYVCIRVSWQA